MLASDMKNREFSNPMNPDDILTVQFYKNPIQNNFQTELQGRPIFEEKIFVKIMTPGNQLNIIDTEAREDHKRRFPRQWAFFQNSESQEQLIGTPVDQWPIISKSQSEELKALKFYTVEQIANASDLQKQSLGMLGTILPQQAKAFLAKAQDSALVQHQAAELERRQKEINDLKSDQEKILKTVEEMKENQKNALLNTPKVKRKYTKKAVSEIERAENV